MLTYFKSLLIEEELSCFRRLGPQRTCWSLVEFAYYDGTRYGRFNEGHQIGTRCQKVSWLSDEAVRIAKWPLNFPCRDLSAHPDSSKTRRKSIYNFFLRHQDAVDDHMTSPSVHKKVMKPSETIFSLKSSETPTSPPAKSKRATSFIKKKPRLERGLSDQSVLRLNRNVHLGRGGNIYFEVEVILKNFFSDFRREQLNIIDSWCQHFSDWTFSRSSHRTKNKFQSNSHSSRDCSSWEWRVSNWLWRGRRVTKDE